MKKKDLLINVAISLITFFILFEIVLRVVTPEPVFSSEVKLIPYRNLVYSVNLSGVSPTIHFTTNKWGFRGDPVPRDLGWRPLILTIGGSTTQCFYLDDSRTWPYLLQNEPGLRVLVENAGIDGHSTKAHLLMMREVVPKVKPKLVIFLVGINDLGKSFQDISSYESTPIYYKLFSQSRVFQLFYTWFQILSGQAVISKAAHTNIVLKNLTEPETKFSEGFVSELVTLPEYEANLRELIRLGKEQGVDMVFMTQPLLFSDEPRWENISASPAWIAKNKYAMSARTYAKMLNIYNAKLLQVCAEEQVDCFDLAAKVPHSQDYFYDDAHFNEKGASLVAEELAKYLVQRQN